MSAVSWASGRLPVRTPGAALEEGREVMDDFQRAMNDFQMEPSAENLAATREVIETWPA